MVKRRDRLERTIAFLRMAASGMRQLAERAPDIAVELRRTALELEAEADQLDEAERH